MLEEDDRQYLQSRFYTDELIEEEKLYSIPAGTHILPGTSRSFNSEVPMIAFECRSMGETLSAIHTCSRVKKEYRYHQIDGLPYLPILYSSISDRELLFKDKTVILTEGTFDRIAVKRALPEYAVMARLSKGTSIFLSLMLKRYATRVWLAFDNDEAGEKGAKMAIHKMGEGVETVELFIPYKDPALVAEKRGVAHLRDVLRSQMERYW